MVKIDLQDAYFKIPLHSQTEICKISMGKESISCLCLCFSLGPAPRIFTRFLLSIL